ncbi:hypothetical protein [Motilimonas cestriensis]|uniref:hypothetical protein n=1 Tax=Motilimonas cestriensis TaxID=2742685 RepID=UPI003DA3E064
MTDTSLQPVTEKVENPPTWYGRLWHNVITRYPAIETGRARTVKAAQWVGNAIKPHLPLLEKILNVVAKAIAVLGVIALDMIVESSKERAKISDDSYQEYKERVSMGLEK